MMKSRVEMETILCMFMCSLGFSNGLGIRRPTFTFTSSDYPKILKTAAFVDKTLMIRNVIEDPGVVLITAPPRFGKSTNLDMVKRFFEVEVDEDGGLKTTANLTDEAVTDTPNYKLFMDNKLKITENKSLMEEHFGKTPVIKVDFRCANVVKTYDDAIDFCKTVIHKTYRDHGYLLHSERLSQHHKALFERWYNETTYMNLSKQHVAHGLRVLTVNLYRHFRQRRVLVLIDEHDSVISKAMFDVEGAEVLRKIIALSVSMMSTALRNNDLYVKGGIISGVSDIPMFGFSDLNNVKTCRFLEEHRYLDYYGLTKLEVEELLRKPEFQLNPNLLKDAQAAYNGYQSERGKKIFNTYSLLRFLKMGEIRNYWTKFGTIKKLRNVFKIPAFKHYVEKLVSGNSISIVLQEKLTVEEVIDLRNLLMQPHSQINYWPATLFNYLFKQGYLTFMPVMHKTPGVSVKKCTVKIPNTEVRDYIARFV